MKAMGLRINSNDKLKKYPGLVSGAALKVNNILSSGVEPLQNIYFMLSLFANCALQYPTLF